MAPPKRKVTKEQVQRIEELALLNCHTRTIALVVGIPEETLRRRYGELIEKKRAEHRVNVRQAQDDKRVAADTTMLIWLGKNDLGQSDKREDTLKMTFSDLVGQVLGGSNGGKDED